MSFISELQDCTYEQVLYDEPMKKHTSLCVGGNADYFVNATSLSMLNKIILSAKKHRVPYAVIGGGSNVLVGDKGFHGVIISTLGLDDIFFKRDEIYASCGAPLSKLLNFTLENRLKGLEFLAGIPGTVGGGVVMNTGAFNSSLSKYITTVEVLSNGKIEKFDKENCRFAYRESRFKGKNKAVTAAVFSLEKGDREESKSIVKNYLEYRNKLQPKGKSCGSVFKNPNGISAGELIEKAHLKGFCLGGAVISLKHGNFIINESGASALDVYAIIQYIKRKIFDEFKVKLCEEVVYLGEF